MTTKISTDNIQQASLEVLGVGAGITVYQTLAELPLSGNSTGDKAYVKETTRLYLWNGVGWFNIALINMNPSITVGPDSTYVLYGDGTPTIIELTATDPEGIPITWSYQVTSGSLGGTTVANVGNIFTITPGNLISDAGEFTLTFTASDGVNIDTAGADLRIRFGARDPYYTQSYTYASSPVNDLANKTFIDQSENVFTVTPNGNATQGIFTPYSPGGWSGAFDGTGDFLSTVGSTALSLDADFTISFWMNSSALGSAGGILSNNETSFIGQAAAFITSHGTAPNRISFWVYNIATGAFLVASTTPLTVGRWYHIAVSRQSGTLRLFVNGVQEASRASSAGTVNLVANGSFNMGKYWSGSFTGYLSDVHIVKGTAIYTADFPLPTAPVTAVANTVLLTLQDKRFRDSSTNNFAITRNGDTKISPVSPFLSPNPYNPSAYGGSAYFDGTGDYLTTPSSTQLDFGTDDFTIETWVNFNALSSNRMLLDRWQTGNAGGWQFYWRATGTSMAFFVGSAIVVQDPNATRIDAGTWNHVAVTRSGTTVRLFVNGLVVATATNSASLSNSLQLAAGIQLSTLTNPFNGYLSNTRIVKGTALYTANFTLPTSPVTAVSGTSLLLNFANVGIYEESGKVVVETVGNARSSNAVVKTSNTSMFFDGTGNYCIVSAEQNVNTLDFTIEAWVYPTAWAGTQNAVFSTRASTANSTSEWALGVHNTGYPYIYSDAFQITGTATQVPLNTWTHLTVTRTAGSMRLFVNGVVANTTNSNQNYTQPIGAIGANRNGSEQWTGYISDLRLTEVKSRYISNFTPPQTKIGFNQSDTNYSLLFEPEQIGQAAFTTSGTYSWTAPPGVTNVSAVCVGGGGGSVAASNGATGAGGGGLGWKNNIPVTPGQSYTVTVGAGGARAVPASGVAAPAGSNSWFVSTSTVFGRGGGGGIAVGSVGGTGGTFIGDGGGNGGNGGTRNGSTAQCGGGGGAGGYSGNGGNGGNGTTNNSTAGSGGGGGGGGGGGSVDTGGGGGGVGIYGEGASGLPGPSTASDGRGGFGGSGGAAARLASTSTVSGDFYGTGAIGSGPLGFGGGGSGSDNSAVGEQLGGADGAVRLIWGAGRAFPSTNTQDI